MKLLSFQDLYRLKGIGASKSTLHRLTKLEKFPAPVKIGTGPTSRNCWVEAEIDAWLETKLSDRSKAA
jgi:predicted DNA-binding transcriptional regulator AlpA